MGPAARGPPSITVSHFKPYIFSFKNALLERLINQELLKKLKAFHIKVSITWPDQNLSGIAEGGVQLGALGTTATNRPTVTAPGDSDDAEIGAMMIGRGNRSTRRKHAPVPLCPTQSPHAVPG
jgi:hypothetical protein